MQDLLKDPRILAAALDGLLLQKERLALRIEEVRTAMARAQTDSTASQLLALKAKFRVVPPLENKPRRRKMSRAARERIAVAQKKRWAEYRRNKEDSGSLQEAVAS